ncbi:MAG: glucosyltransferase domain-containing protein [Pseudomonadota bacterium]
MPKIELTAALKRMWREAFQPLIPVYALLFALAWIAFGAHASGLLFSIDDWGFTHRRAHFDWMISIGRWLNALAIRHLSGEILAPAASLFVMLALQASAITLLLWTGGCRSRVAAFLVLAIFLFHPLAVESVQVEIVQVAIGLTHAGTILAGLIAWHLANASPGPTAAQLLLAILATALLLAVALAGFQHFVVLTPMTFVTCWIMQAIGPDTDRETVQRIIRRVVILGAITALGIGLYLVSATLAKWLFSVPTTTIPYYNFTHGLTVDADRLAITRERTPIVILQFYAQAQHMIALPEKLAALGLMALTAWGTAVAFLSGKRPDLLLRVAVCVTGMLTLMLLPFVPTAVRAWDIGGYNPIAALAFTHAIFALVAITSWQSSRIALLPLFFAGYLAANFVHTQNAAAIVALNENRRDFFTANRLLTDLQRTEAYRKAEEASGGTVRLVVVGAQSTPRAGAFRLDETTGPLNFSRADCGLITCNPTGLPLALNLLSTDRIVFEHVSPAEFDDALRLEAKARIQDRAPWPDPEGIFALSNGLTVVFLGRSRESRL